MPPIAAALPQRSGLGRPAADRTVAVTGPDGTAPAGATGRFDLLTHPMFFFAHILARFDENVVLDLRLHGFSQSDWRIVSTLQYTGDATLTELARITTLERSFVGRMVADLEKRGLVERFCPPNDRRTTGVRLTGAGFQAFERLLLPTTATQIAQALDGVGKADRDTLFRILGTMMSNVYHVAREPAPILDDRPGPAQAR